MFPTGQTKNVKYFEREEDPELKKMYEEELAKFKNMSKDLEGSVDGELYLDLMGNISIKDNSSIKKEEEGGIKGSGTYVLRDGKLVPGEGEKRE